MSVASLKRNMVASYVGQATAAVTGIIMLPVFVQYLGAEAYGLVGFFAMLQSWSLLLDMGMTPTLSRELARYSAGVLTQQRVATMIRTMEWIFLGLGVVCALSVGLSANWSAHHWLKARQLSADEVALCIALMGGMLGVQWLGGVYRAGLVGLERMVVLNIAVIIATIGRTVGAWLVLKYLSATPRAFFTFHLAAGVVEVVAFRLLFYQRFSMKSAPFWPQLASLHGSRAMAGGMAFLATLWIVVSQSDKLVLSWLLDLPTYGAFAVVTSLAGGINQLAGPMVQSLQPRLVTLAAQGQRAALEDLYRTSTQLMTAGLFSIAGIMACFAGPLLLAWTGNAELAQRGAQILPLYVLGNATASVLSLAFAVQFAFGRLRWQIIGSCVFGLFWVPGGYLAARYAGAVGTGWVWLVCNVMYLVTWLPYIHSRILPGFWRRWLAVDVGLVLLVEGAALAVARLVGLPFSGRIQVLAAIGFATMLLAILGVLAVPQARGQGVELLRRLRMTLSKQGS
jgi:O-antigen/teichoic acid export membrane protein